MYDKSNNVSGNGSELKDFAASVEKQSKIIAIVIAVASTLAGALFNALMGAVGGLLIGGVLGFAFVVIEGNTARALRAIGDVDDNVAATAGKINSLAEELEETTSNISSQIKEDIKEEIKNINVVAAPVETKKAAPAPKAEEEKKPAPAVTKKEEEKPVETKKPAFATAAPAPVEETPEEPRRLKTIKVSEMSKEDIANLEAEDEAQAETPKKTFTPIPAPVVKEEEKRSPFAPANNANTKKDDSEKKSSAPAASTQKKGSLYRCDVCGNMVNQTPCPRCAIKNKSKEVKEAEVKAEAEVKEEKSNSNIWAAATKPATASDLANKASAFKKNEPSVEDIPDVAPENVAKKEEPVNAPSSPFASPKKEEPAAAPASVSVKKSSLYRCDVCGNMVNATPCPRCLIKSRKAGAKPNEEAAPAPAAKEEENKEDVNPIWAAATKPSGSFGSSGGSKLMESNAALAPMRSSLTAGATATEAPSWAKPAPGVSEAKPEEEEVIEPVHINLSKPKPEPKRPIWEMAAENEVSNNGGAKPGWMQ